MELEKVIDIIEKNCVNCHKCISVCPVKYCNDGSEDHIKLNHNLCIGCGTCIDACDHKARVIVDDFDKFIYSINRKEDFIAIVAPSIVSEFEEKYLKLNGFLKSIGIKAIFDVGFGAELAIKSYIEYSKSNSNRPIITQPCPAIVSFIEIYKPELLNYLAKVDSPMTHTIKMVKKFFKAYKDFKIVVISPCIAKKREFQELKLENVMNVTYKSLKEYLETNKIDLNNYPEIDYDGPQPERGSGFSSPGGLLETLIRDNKEIVSKARKIEGICNIYPYFEELKKSIDDRKAPLLIDCLSCEKGCNGGTGTTKRNLPIDEIEYYINKRKNRLIKENKKIHILINKYWNVNLYDRSYINLNSNFNLKIPSKIELEDIYKRMLKEDERDFLNCNSCGYGSCEKMAFAIFNNLNKIENCHHYQNKLLNRSNLEIEELNKKLIIEIGNILSSTDSLVESNINIEELIDKQFSQMSDSFTSIEQIINNINTITKELQENTKILTTTSSMAKNGNNLLENISKDFKDIILKTYSINEIITTINEITEKTNLLSINASIEASHAGNYGKGFSIVSQEIRKLALRSKEKSKNIHNSIHEIIINFEKLINNTNKNNTEIQEILKNIITIEEYIKKVVARLDEITASTQIVNNSIKIIVNYGENIKNLATNIKKQTHNIKTSLSNLKNQ